MSENRKNYHWLAERFRRRIVDDAWKTSEKIPTERALSDEFSVTRVTIRRALRLLEDEKLIRRVQGSGTYVNPKSGRRIPLMIDYAGSMSEHSPELKRKLLRKKWIAADEELAADLNLKVGTRVLTGERVDSSPNGIVAYDHFHIQEEFAENISDSVLETIDFVGAWSEAEGIRIENCRQIVEAELADAECRKHLKMPAGSPVLKSTECYFTNGCVPTGMFVSYYHPERICISSNCNWSV
ncbi:MAG: GntR family transcriptional regulator [Victivallales bacterium]|nr:GntR family transcriptional regulator [Victivallales bacterium]